MKSALRLRCLALAIIAFMITMSGIYCWRLVLNHRSLRIGAIETAGKRASQLAELQAHHIEALLLGLDSSLRQFRDALQSNNQNSAQMIAKNVLGMYPAGSIVHLARIDVAGYFQYTTVELPKPVYVGDRDYFRFYQAHNGIDQLFINKPIFSRSAHKWVILITRPINKSGHFDGAAFISLSPKYFADMLAKLEMAPGDIHALLHEDGTFMARSRDLEKTFGKSIHPDRPPLQPGAPRHGIFHAQGSLDNQPRIFAWHKLENYPLIVVVGLDEKAILAPIENDIHRTNRRSLIGNGFILALTAGLFLLLLRVARQQETLEKNEQAFREQSQRLEEVIWGTDAGTWEWYVRTDEAFLNERWAGMLGYTLNELSHKTQGILKRSDFNFLVHPDSLRLADEQMERCFRKETDIFDCEVQMKHKEGHWIWVLARGRVVEWDQDGRPVRMSGTHQDITARKLSEKKLQCIAHYDLLTDLPNRALLADRMQNAIAQCRRRGESLAVAYIDLDGFKEVNDLYGHDVGDQLLVTVARQMQSTVREVDTLARIGGDEFVVLLVGLKRPSDCEPLLGRILGAVSEPLTVGDKVMKVSASIGVTLFPQEDADEDLLLRQADQAMYVAKQLGKNRYHVFDIDQATAMAAQREDVERLHRALEDREFVLHYQPKVNMRSGEIIGAEALIRWQHPDRGLLAPAAFLPAIENHILSIDIGEWVIETALAQMTAWQAQGQPIPVSVNISPRQLLMADFASRLSRMVTKYPAVSPDHLELEILETSALEDLTSVSKLINDCKQIGVRFAMDDFGTGYSSLSYLKRLPVDVLKIDRTFVHDLLEGSDNMSIVHGMISLAQAFRRIVIAEGVETVEQGRVLLDLGCELAQGYAIARPMPAEQFQQWAATWQSYPLWTHSSAASG